MKVSLSLPDEDVSFLDNYAQERGETRSGAVHRAVRLLREIGLAADYASAWDEWSEEAEIAWDTAASDGIGRDAAR